MAQFNVILKLLRNEKNMSQQELADALKISKSAINMYERGERQPNFETLELIADYFNVDIDYLLGRTNKTTKIISPSFNHVVSNDNEHFERGKKHLANINDNFLFLDENGQDVVVSTFYNELNRCTATSGDVPIISNIIIEEPIFLKKDSFNYNSMKEQAKELRLLKKKSHKDYMDIVRFLWSIGYNSKICIVDLICVIYGLKVPSAQLYEHIASYFTGSYEIKFPNKQCNTVSHFTNYEDAVNYLKQFDMIAACDGKNLSEKTIIQMANAVLMNQPK